MGGVGVGKIDSELDYSSSSSSSSSSITELIEKGWRMYFWFSFWLGTT